LVLVALTVLVVVATTSLAVLHHRAVARALSRETEGLVPKLLRADAGRRIDLLGEAVPGESWEGELADALRSAPTPELRAAAANEALGDLELLFASRSRWAPSAVRIALLGGLLFGALSLIRGDWIVAVVVVVLSALGAGACASLSSRAQASEKAQRKLADALVDALVPGLPRAEATGRRFRDVW
jgi:hypothetical protein